MIQTININATLASEVIQSDEAMDGFIFAYMVKLTFVSGRIKDASIPRICEVLGVGNRVARRGLKSALEHGYVRYEGNDIIANNINRRLDYIYPLQIELKRMSERPKSDTPRCPFKYTQLRKFIRKVVIENHISKQQDFCNTSECSVNPHSHKQYVRALRRIKRMCKKTIAENTDRLSNRRVMEVANLKRSTAKSIMREMVKSNTLSKSLNIEHTEIDIQSELGMDYANPKFRRSAKRWILNYADNVEQGFPILTWRYVDERNCRLMVDIQYANSYKVNHSKSRLFL